MADDTGISGIPGFRHRQELFGAEYEYGLPRLEEWRKHIRAMDESGLAVYSYAHH